MVSEDLHEVDCDRHARYRQILYTEILLEVCDGWRRHTRRKGRHERDDGQERHDRPLLSRGEVQRILGVVFRIPPDDTLVEICQWDRGCGYDRLSIVAWIAHVADAGYS